MKRLAVSALATALIAASGSAFAHDRDNGYDQYNDYNDDAGYNSGYDSDYDYQAGYRNNRSNSDTAQVIRVDPIIDRYRAESRQHCWIEQSRYDDRRYYNHGGNASGALLGAVIGGALGNQVGHGDGRAASTIAGAVIGGSIGNNANRYDHYDGYNGYRDGSIRRCERVGDNGRDGYDGYDERVVAYNVTYRYAGRTYHTITNYHPGNTLRVTVSVQPEASGVAYGY